MSAKAMVHSTCCRLGSINMAGDHTCVCVCSSHETDLSTIQHTAKPVSVPMPPRETSSVVTNYKIETHITKRMQQDDVAMQCQS